MSQNASNPEPAASAPPVSSFTGPIAELVGHGLLSPPSRPGLLATLDRFEILRILGGGGMGLVLLARDSNTEKNVAIKLVKPDLVVDRQVTHLFVKEAGHMQRLRHANVMPVLEVSDRPQGPYFVMPYFERGSLARCIQPGQALETELILDIALQIADGLQFAHRRGIIHRDLKPANILLAAGGKACLGDFGLARSMFNDTIVDVERQQCEGTAPYMSPAVAAGHAEDTRCDIYAFGALLYEMLTGEPPYKGRSTKEIRNQIIAGPPKPILGLNPAANQGLVTVAEGAMGRELRDRYADMADVLADLQRIKEGTPPVGPRGITGKMRGQLAQVGRIPGTVWLAICVVAIVILGWMIWRTGELDSTSIPTHPNPTLAPANTVHPAVATNVTPPVAAAANPPAISAKTNPAVAARVPGALTFATLAGQAATKGSVDGVGTNAQFNVPSAVALDGLGNVYVADTANNTIRRITPDGTVSTLAGLAGSSGNTDGSSSSARFLAPFGIAADNAGNVYVADTANNTIRKITPTGVVSTLAGLAKYPGNADGTGDNARFRNPWSIAVDSAGNLYVADSSNDTIRKITPGGATGTLAGLAGSHGSTDGIGSNARFWNPEGVAVDSAGNVYVADTGNNMIRKITSNGMVTTLAGLAGSPGSADGTGSIARFSSPQGLAVDSAGNVYVADTDNSTIRKITPAGLVSTVAGQPGSPTGFA
ncbi:MAG TPA: protein kinase, partial [Verrucomicrobiae bacterium]|nr:protein kinase [Verrucomicrobiae bacterium]